MKTICTIMAVAFPCLWAQDSPPPASVPPQGKGLSAASESMQAGADVGLNAYLDASNRIAEAMRELSEILLRVDSRESADAACESVRQATRKLLEANQAAERLPAPSSELQTELVDQLTQSGFIDTTQQFLRVLMNLAAHECYESEALRETLKVLEDAQAGS